MRAGDIVHFKKERTARYGKEGGCLGIKSMEDGTSHFITDMHEYLAGAEEWREMALKQLAI